MTTRDYQGRKFEIDMVNNTVDPLPVEAALQININGKPITITMRTPGNDVSLVRGLLFTEGILPVRGGYPELMLEQGNDDGIVTSVNIVIPEEELGDGYANSRSLLSVSSCGICGRTELEEISNTGLEIDIDVRMDNIKLHAMFKKMNDRQNAFRRSGGTHAAAAFTFRGTMLCSMEDIGRHNAVDKVIGDLILKKNLDNASCMTVSGRVSYEIVVKCFKAGIPFLAAVSAPSSLAVDYAKELGITLLGFCREDRATCYSHPRRMKINKQYVKAS